MSERETDSGDTAPGDEAAEGEEFAGGTSGYVVGLGLAALLTAAAFAMVNLPLVWRPAIPMALVVLAIAQMGIHLVFFLHVTTGPDNTNNVLALAFGTLVVLLLIGGSVWILAHLDHNMMPMGRQMHGFP
ncbi:cytochrome o ubiquinol oxidase subunit IV [Sphingomonas sp. ABOLD]|jgi:cytochrome o ubiquinol oxidase operon protein cyoD|uniref:Cytochrome bo(3) ubiquinol oxidase subunit 4 n=1 Tax=Sphingomonas trueperi TaxID=53317 RepID=A0A7X5XVF8_9SPHN|nr:MULTISPECIES: cytochrome o ubiquinol oxidase subunit IV [Sphingomonas]NJB96059.1 cytochrome o ubiquinol oxidase operon protein cyoD [Sphingomonas trueperi]RSV42761.1 cytochrome o ubiquinol oxidase subunit IV [Sphingomonas sp. ABOLD]RSV44836.1 cytochrome o ubiquinol oxidase subunit IV [Sphingomonas sp. ABOLE]